MNPVEIPLIAYGTWVENIEDAPKIRNRVRTAIELGYRHIDTARNYQTESYAIDGIIDSQIPRQLIFLTSKIFTYTDVETLKVNLGSLQYYDLLLLHYPPLKSQYRNDFKNVLTILWEMMQLYLDEGITKFIGISNFYQNHLDILLEICDERQYVLPSVNQIEINIVNSELSYVKYMQDRNIIVFAYSPLGGLASQWLLNNDIILDIAIASNINPVQIIIAYLLSRRIGVVTASKNPDHMIQSIKSADFIDQLTDNDIERLNAIDTGIGPSTEGAIAAFTHNIYL